MHGLVGSKEAEIMDIFVNQTNIVSVWNFENCLDGGKIFESLTQLNFLDFLLMIWVYNWLELVVLH